MTETLDMLLAHVPAFDTAAAAQAQARLDTLTKPPGSLGVLETLAVQLAGITGQVRPQLAAAAVLVAAGDHGVVAEGISPYPQAVTAQMVGNFLAGGAAISALARNAGARVIIADAGIATPLPAHPQLHRLGLGGATANLRHNDAMSRDEAEAAVLAGARLVAQEWARAPFALLALGEMGIGNTTAAACLTSFFTGTPPDITVGRGTGLDDAGVAHKRLVVADALARVAPTTGPLGALAALGGREIAVLAGAALAASARRVPLILDGYISTSAALVAATLCPPLRSFFLAAHQSAEGGHRVALAHLGLRPLLQWDMRLGEGSGAALVVPLVRAAARMIDEMATFAEAGVSDRGDA